MSTQTRDGLSRRFHQEFGQAPRLSVRAPGRVNLLGEHTDYNDGFVFPVAIDREISVLAARRDDRRIRVCSIDFSQRSDFDLDGFQSDRRAPWSNYIRGVVSVCRKRGLEVPGMDLLITGSVPIGAGLSSSAALEVAVAEAIRVLGDLRIEKKEMALLCQAAEREFVGVQCGIMDQFVCALARKGTALFLDCRDLSFSLVPLRFDASIVVCDSRVQRSLDGSAYNTRRHQCEEAVRRLRERLGGITALRDVTPGQLDQHRSALPDPELRAARHVIGENARVLEGLKHLEADRVEDFGRLLYLSHNSLRDDYRVSCPELDLLVELAARQPGTLGARMTGAGFGGCTVNLVRAGAVDQFREAVVRGYHEGTGREPLVYVCAASEGVTSTRLRGPSASRGR